MAVKEVCRGVLVRRWGETRVSPGAAGASVGNDMKAALDVSAVSNVVLCRSHRCPLVPQPNTHFLQHHATLRALHGAAGCSWVAAPGVDVRGGGVSAGVLACDAP